MFRLTALLALVWMVSGCGDKPKRESWPDLASEFVYTSLANSPATATQVGYHVHNGVRLDAELDNLSEQEHERQRQWYRGLRLRIAQSIDPSQLSAEDRADFDIVNGQIALALLELEDIRSDRHNPTLYVELAGNALYSPFVLDYAAKPDRYRHIISRLEKLPALFEQARDNLVSSPEVWTRTAVGENEGNIALVNEEMRQGCPPELRAAYDKAAEPALAALRSFQRYLSENLIHRGYDWRLGKDLYTRKFRLALATDQTPEQALAAAETTLREVRQTMLEIATPFYRKLHPDGEGERDLNKVVGEVLAEISKRHASPDTYFANARRDLEEARQFVRARKLLTLPARDNLQVIETPEFMRGIYSVGGFSPAPALEPQLGAFYWITPIPKDWSAQRVESKLREYNDYGLKLLTLHEAMPGHYVQLEYSNDVQPQLRRVLRSVYGNSAYVEGWAVYATEMMLDEGLLDNSPELRLTFLKQQLRMIANTILDVRLQTMGMTDEQAMRLMLDDGFQESEEASGKLRRAKLSSAQLPTYFVGWRDWHRLRSGVERVKGGEFQLKDFHERSLRAGAVPLPVLSRLLTEKTR